MSFYQQLEEKFQRRYALRHLQAICGWDEAVMMPSGGGEARANALAHLQTLLHQQLTEPVILELIEKAEQESLNDWQKQNLALIKKQYQQAVCLPDQLVHQLTKATIECEQAWRTLRANNDWKSFAPILNQVFQYVKESAEIRADILGLTPYDVLLDQYSPGITQKHIDPIFNTLKEQLPPLIEAILKKKQSPHLPKGPFSIEKQRELGLKLMQHIGFDFAHGRLDISHHPFCGGVPEDVRITTRYNENEFISAMMGICHETGHACYEQGLPALWRAQPVGEALGMSVHESQSLLIEMQACRSAEFIEFLAPKITETFGPDAAFDKNNLQNLYTQVKKGFIRVDADEVTYPLHVILRYELEQALFNNTVSIAELPEAWNDKMQTYLGLSTLGQDQNGVMQDVHWPSGAFGYFPAYTLGRLIAAQLYQKAEQAVPSIASSLKQGNFTPLMHWLRTNVHEKASLYSMPDLLKKATGEPLNPQHFIAHIKKRYLE